MTFRASALRQSESWKSASARNIIFELYTVASLYLFVNSVDKTKLSFQENWKSFVLFALAPTKTNRGPFHKSNAPFLQICWLIKIFMALSNIAIFSSKLSARFNFFVAKYICSVY